MWVVEWPFPGEAEARSFAAELSNRLGEPAPEAAPETLRAPPGWEEFIQPVRRGQGWMLRCTRCRIRGVVRSTPAVGDMVGHCIRWHGLPGSGPPAVRCGGSTGRQTVGKPGDVEKLGSGELLTKLHRWRVFWSPTSFTYLARCLGGLDDGEAQGLWDRLACEGWLDRGGDGRWRWRRPHGP